MRVGVGNGVGVGFGEDGAGGWLVREGVGYYYFTLAAVAAAETAFAEVVVTDVLGAAGADTRRFFTTDAAEERHVLSFPLSFIRGLRE